jgi:glycine/D-amino acid oxidase-like deaminating enzyme
VKGLRTEGDRIVGVETDSGVLVADKYVVAMGSYSPPLLRTNETYKVARSGLQGAGRSRTPSSSRASHGRYSGRDCGTASAR